MSDKDEDAVVVAWVSEIEDEEDFRKRLNPKRPNMNKRMRYQKRMQGYND